MESPSALDGLGNGLSNFTPERQEIRSRHQWNDFISRREFSLVGIQATGSEAVVWWSFHDIDWVAGQCHTGGWVRSTAHGRDANEALNAMVHYAFEALGMKRVGVTHSRGNEVSRHIAEKLGLSFERMSPERLCFPWEHSPTDFAAAS